MAAHLGSKLAQPIANVLSISKQQMIFWSDSTDVLWWVRGYSQKFKPFVANRIGEIQSSSNQTCSHKNKSSRSPDKRTKNF